jgi:hypothetical protein
MFDSDGRLIAVFWLAIVESWSEIAHTWGRPVREVSAGWAWGSFSEILTFPRFEKINKSRA